MITFRQYMENSDSSGNTDDAAVVDKIKKLNLRGWGGHCGNAAIEINNKVFGGKGKYIVAVNKFLWEQYDEPVGHVVVKFNEKLWDTNGLTDMDHLESWGMVDENDSNYTDLDGWTIEAAYEVEVLEMSEDQVKLLFNKC